MEDDVETIIPVWKISIHYARAFPCWCAELGASLRCTKVAQDFAELSAQEMVLNLLSALEKILWHFSYTWKMVIAFSKQLEKLCWPLWLDWPFSWPFQASFTSHVCWELCGPNVPGSHKPYYAGHPPPTHPKNINTIMLPTTPDIFSITCIFSSLAISQKSSWVLE